MIDFDARQPCAFSKHLLEFYCTTTGQMKKMKTKEKNIKKLIRAIDNFVYTMTS